MPALGRIHAPDERDERFLLRAVVPRSTLDWRYWYDAAWTGDQNGYPWCVAFAWSHLWTGSPVTHPQPGLDPARLYQRAQEIDEWPGEDYDGTSVRAGAKVLANQGLIAEYRWAWDLDTLIDAVLEKGPAVVGTNWYDGMFDPVWGYDALGERRLLLRVTGDIAGGHAWLINGVNIERRTFRMKNSWGLSWGVNGRASITFEDMERLLHEDGEVCLPIETP